MQSNLLILLLINLAFAAALDNVPEEETNRVHQLGPSSSEASEKRTQFREECGGDSACVRGKMRDWRKAKKAGEASFDRGGLGQFWLALKKRTQFMEECDGDSACVRGKMKEWRKAKKAGEASLDRGGLGQFWLALKKRTQFIEECDGDSACVRGKMRDWRMAKKAGEASLDRGPPVAQFQKECDYDMA